MMKRFLLLLILAATLSGCYHATIDTGLRPSGQVVHQAFASSWIYGLVPPSTVATASACPNGVARVETQLSFVNQVVGILTAGIYTPMEIKVTCAESGQASAEDASDAFTVTQSGGIAEAFTMASVRAVETGKPTYVRFQ